MTHTNIDITNESLTASAPAAATAHAETALTEITITKFAALTGCKAPVASNTALLLDIACDLLKGLGQPIEKRTLIDAQAARVTTENYLLLIAQESGCVALRLTPARAGSDTEIATEGLLAGLVRNLIGTVQPSQIAWLQDGATIGVPEFLAVTGPVRPRRIRPSAKPTQRPPRLAGKPGACGGSCTLSVEADMLDFAEDSLRKAYCADLTEAEIAMIRAANAAQYGEDNSARRASAWLVASGAATLAMQGTGALAQVAEKLPF